MSPVYRIAEDALHLSDEVQSAFPEYPWNDIRGFRNFVAHGYREVDRSLSWKVIVDDIPELEKALRIFKERQGQCVVGWRVALDSLRSLVELGLLSPIGKTIYT